MIERDFSVQEVRTNPLFRGAIRPEGNNLPDIQYKGVVSATPQHGELQKPDRRVPKQGELYDSFIARTNNQNLPSGVSTESPIRALFGLSEPGNDQPNQK